MNKVWLDEHPIKKVNKTVIVSDIGDYSLFINKDITGAVSVLLKSKKSSVWIEVENYFASPSGSVLYFKESIKNLFKENCIYPINIRVPMSDMDIRRETKQLHRIIRRKLHYINKPFNVSDAAYYLYSNGHISVEEYLNKVFI